MTFQHLLDGAEFLSQSGNPDVTGVEYDSRRVKPGCAFVAMRGESSDGNRFIDQAIHVGSSRDRHGFADREAARRSGVGIGTTRPAGAGADQREFL